MNHLPERHCYTGGLLDRAADRRGDAAWLEHRLAEEGSLLAPFAGERPLVRFDRGGGAAIAWQPARDARANGLCREPVVLLGLDGDGAARFAAELASEPQTEARLKAVDLRSLAVQGLLAGGELGLLAQAKSMLSWHGRHRFCANCGAATEVADGGYRRLCRACGAEHFPRVDPVVIVVARHRDRFLLGRQRHFAPGVYSALAGFVEPGESLAEAVRREVLEETGVHLASIAYHSDQPWPFPSSLMIGCLAEAEATTLRIDRDELEDARWFARDELAAMLEGRHGDGLATPPPIAIAHHLIRAALEV